MHNRPRLATAKPASRLHPRNRHQGHYDFASLIKACKALARFVAPNPYGTDSINFADPEAVKTLNRALLQRDYGVRKWDIPPGFLCPPIPGRADYLHYLADLLASHNQGKIPYGPAVRALDIGVGANCIYPLIGCVEYGWEFVGSDIAAEALKNAGRILDDNPELHQHITLRQQTLAGAILESVIQPGERFDLTMCNPPFHASRAEAMAGAQRKWRNLGKAPAIGQKPPRLNFGGHAEELWCKGGEEAFVRGMIRESTRFARQCCWFTSLVAKSSSLPAIYRSLKQARVASYRTIDMAQGQKHSRLIAWTYLNEDELQSWCAQRS
jgi:23S rRNA (adenine1618-N6)-methyltransferase